MQDSEEQTEVDQHVRQQHIFSGTTLSMPGKSIHFHDILNSPGVY